MERREVRTAENLVLSERNFYRRLLDLGAQEDLEPLLDEALSLIAEVTSAETAYLELFNDGDGPCFWRDLRCTDEERQAIRSTISGGIIARSLAEGCTIESSSAQGDPRFQDLGSVQRNAIGAVLCAPIGSPPIGVVYLQDRTRPGAFAASDREHAELFARQLAPIADRLLARRPERTTIDHTSDIRARFRCPDIIGRSNVLARVLHSASLVAPLDVAVLITGPNGTGKTALAEAIVANGPRAGRPFVQVNCAAIPENLVESELFGSERGAHSTATRRIVGKVAAAEGGTLFLDEVGDLSLGAQAKLLQLLQSHEYTPLGATKAIRADIRVLSATNRDLVEACATNQFRADLYYRLNVVPVEMPSLADRRDDIHELVEYFCERAVERHRLAPLMVSHRAVRACAEAPWPGHVRQLGNAVEAGVIRAAGDRCRSLLEHHIFPAVAREDGRPPTYHESTRVHQRRLVLEALERNDWNVVEAARELELARSYVYNLIREFDLSRSNRS